MSEDLIDKIDLFLDPARREIEPRVGQIGHNRMFIADRAKAIDEAQRTIDFVCSTPDVDRYGEIVLPSAFAKSLATFAQNPAFPFGHSYEAHNETTPTVGHWKSMAVMDNALVGKAYFKPRGLGEQCWQDYREGNLTSVSVAWLTRAWEMRELEIDGTTRRVRVFTEVDLLEVSAVLIPAQPNARIRAASAAGVDDDALADRIERILNNLLDTGPGGRLCTLIEDVASAAQGHAGRSAGYFGDIPGDEDDTPASRSAVQGDPELKTALRDALAR